MKSITQILQDNQPHKAKKDHLLKASLQ